MSFATAKALQASDRFVLVRISPARYANDSLVLTSGVYQMTFNYPIRTVTRNSTTLTRVYVTPTVNDTYQLDETTGVLKIKLASAPSSTTNVIIVNYYLFYTSAADVMTYETPGDNTTTVRQWEPRVSKIPSFGASFDNILAGVFTFADGGITIENGDAVFQAYLTSNDSFNDKQIDVWMCINDVSNIRRVYQGKIKSIDLSATDVSISFYDAFSTLNQTAFMGDTRFEAFFLAHASSKPNMDISKSGVPCRYIAGWSNRSLVQSYYGGRTIVNYVPEIEYRMFDGDDAVNVNFTSQTSTSVNRSWGLGRIPGTLRMSSVGSIVAIGWMTAEIIFGYVLINFSTHNYDVGDTFEWVQGGTTHRGLVTRADEFQYIGVTYNLCVYESAASGSYPNFQFASTVTSKKKIAISVVGDMLNDYRRPQQLTLDTDFAVTQVTTSGGNTYVEITLANNFENGKPLFLDSSSGTYVPLDPTKQRVLFRIYPSASVNHADVVKRLVESAGLTTDATTFTAAAAALTANAHFSIPNFDETDYGTYQRYIEDVLKSTLGYLTINTSAAAEYYLLSAASSGTAIDDNVYIGDVNVSVDYNDIITEIVAENPHEASTASQSTAENVKAKYLHGVRRTIQLRHVLDSISDRIDDMIAVMSERRAKYRFTVATELLDAAVGDNVTLSSGLILGGGTSDNLKLTSIEKTVDAVSVEATDLQGL